MFTRDTISKIEGVLSLVKKETEARKEVRLGSFESSSSEHIATVMDSQGKGYQRVTY